MKRQVDLMSYLPPFMAQYKEINASLESENPEFALVWEAVDRTLKNEYIETADEYGISRFEKILHILPSSEDSIESRREKIKVKWFKVLPYTWRMLLQKIREICGTNYPITMEQKDCYLISLEVGIESLWQIENLVEVIERMLPCNMGISIKNVLPLDLEISAPVIKTDWFDYSVEYDGAVINQEIRILFQTLYIHVKLPFWDCDLYTGKRRYNGISRYDARRNYGLRVRLKSILELYMEQLIRYKTAFRGSVWNKTDIDLSVLCSCWNQLREILNADVCLYARIQSPCGVIGGMTIETRRNVVQYNGARRYNGAMKYNALHKKEGVE